jgi:hypothetical protein
MLIESHLDKFRRMHATLAKLDPASDCELWIWTAMNGGTHLLNAALHHLALTQELDTFHSQVEGLYCVPDRASGALSDALHAPGDVMHFGQPPLGVPAPASIERAARALKVIEDLREPHVRGTVQIPDGAPARWLAAYRECVTELNAILERPRAAGP